MTTATAPRFSIKPYYIWLAVLCMLMGLGVMAALIVFTQGLVVTNLTDLVPWGLWITIDLSSIALSAGAFTLCAAVYLVGLKEYQPVARTATFIGITGYSYGNALPADGYRPPRPFLACLCLLESSFGFMGSDHVCGSVLHRADPGNFTDRWRG